MNFSQEPAVYIAGAGALIEAGLVLGIAFGLPVTADQKLVVSGFVTVLVTVLTGFVTRTQVSPVAPTV